jgi:4,5-DOPA dioxygenase extradiol
VIDFIDWMHAKIEAGATADLVHYRAHAPHAIENHPTEEHILPLFIALGAGGGHGQRIHASTRNGVLAMDTYAFA